MSFYEKLDEFMFEVHLQYCDMMLESRNIEVRIDVNC
jgi:hypothetical protein